MGPSFSWVYLFCIYSNILLNIVSQFQLQHHWFTYSDNKAIAMLKVIINVIFIIFEFFYTIVYHSFNFICALTVFLQLSR